MHIFNSNTHTYIYIYIFICMIEIWKDTRTQETTSWFQLVTLPCSSPKCLPQKLTYPLNRDHFEKELSFSNHQFSGDMLFFGGNFIQILISTEIGKRSNW